MTAATDPFGVAVGLGLASGESPPAEEDGVAVAAVPPEPDVDRGFGVAVACGRGVGAAVAFGVGTGVGFGVGTGVGFGVGFGVGVGVGLGVGVGVGFGVGVGVGIAAVTTTRKGATAVRRQVIAPLLEIAWNR